MGKSHRIARLNFRKCDDVYAGPVEMVVDYVLGDSHGESDVKWVLRKLDRWKNGSSFTSNSETTYGPDVEDTTTSRLTLEPDTIDGIQNAHSNLCMQRPYRTTADAAMVNSGISVTDSNYIFNGVNLPKLKEEEINCIMRKLTRGPEGGKVPFGRRFSTNGRCSRPCFPVNRNSLLPTLMSGSEDL